MDHVRKKGWGLGLLPPKLRLLVVFSCGTLFILINDLRYALYLLLIGLLLLLASPARNWKLVLSAPFSGGTMFLYNTILSPMEYGGFSFWFININQIGFERGLVTGVRLTGAMLISYAWLFSTTIPEMYESFVLVEGLRPWVMGMLRGLQILRREFVALTQSLIIRGLRWDSPLSNIRNLAPLGMAILPRIVINTQETTLALQSHSPRKISGDGSVLVDGASVRYLGTLPDVLSNINLTVARGEAVYLTGPNMAGKTTLLRLVGGVIPWIMGEFRGRVVSSGHVTHEMPLDYLSSLVRYVAPNPFSSIYGLTVGQEISLLTNDHDRSQRVLEMMGLAALRDQETTKLSGGQLVRLVLSGVLLSDADILLLDSPLQELDPEGRKVFMEAFSALQAERDLTVLVADPYCQEWQSHVDRVLVLEDGQLVGDLVPGGFFTPEWLRRCRLLSDLPKIDHQSPGEEVARMEGVGVILEGNHILRDFDLSLRAGEMVAVTGPNGSGKTTAMLTLSGAIAPAAGEVWTRGRVGYCFQDPRLQTVQMRVDDELGFGPKILGWDGRERGDFIASGLSWTGLGADSCPLDLHPAELRLLSLAASNTSVSVLVLDEPTINLDSVGVVKVVDYINRLLGQGVAVVVITHDQQIASLADRVVVVKDGKGETLSPSGR